MTEKRDTGAAAICTGVDDNVTASVPATTDPDRAAALSELCQDHYEWGWNDGYAQGRADADAELVRALAEALGGPGCVDYGEAVRRHHRALDQRARREAADRGQLGAAA